MDGKIRDLHGQLMQVKQLHDFEKNERTREVRGLGDQMNKLQEIIRQQDQDKRNVLENLARKGDMDKVFRGAIWRIMRRCLGEVDGRSETTQREDHTDHGGGDEEHGRKSDEDEGRLRTEDGRPGDRLLCGRGLIVLQAIRMQGENIAEMDREMKMRWESEQQRDNEQSELFAKQLTVELFCLRGNRYLGGEVEE